MSGNEGKQQCPWSRYEKEKVTSRGKKEEQGTAQKTGIHGASPRMAVKQSVENTAL